MSEQNNKKGSIEQTQTIEQSKIFLDRELLARKKKLIEQFLRSEQEQSDALIGYPNECLQQQAAAQLKQFGKILFYKSTTATYFGNVCNQLYHGYGLLIYKSSNIRFYEGYFQNNCKYGYGLQYINGDVYVGKFVNNKPQDENGIFIWSNGDIYHGTFVNGMKHGQGKWQSGEQFYSGSWKYNKPEGEGFIKSGLSQYKGDIRNGYKHGKGLQLFNNGDRYEGHYSNGKPEGQGIYYWSNGSTYKGQFKNGLRFGYGVWQFGAQKYEGTYINDKRNGQGKYTWGGGSYYIGNFVEDLRHGFGEMHWEAESYYKGQWFQGTQNGYGQIWEGDKLIEKGQYQNGKIIMVNSQQVSDKDKKLLPLTTINKKINNKNHQSFPSERKRFNSFQVNPKQSVKLQHLKNQRTANQISPPARNQKLDRLKQVNQRYSAIANKNIQQRINKTTHISHHHSDFKTAEGRSKEKEQKSNKASINKITLYKRVRKQKQTNSLVKKNQNAKLPKPIDSELMFETQLAPIKWKNFNHISHK